MTTFIIIWIIVSAIIIAYQIYKTLKHTGVAQAAAQEHRLSRRGGESLYAGQTRCLMGLHKWNPKLTTYKMDALGARHIVRYCDRPLCEYGPFSTR